MNHGLCFDAPKQENSEISDHSVEDNNEADMSYFSQTPTKVMLAMSRFSKGNEWIVHRSYINNFPIKWIGLLFPNLQKWVNGRESDDGDKTKALEIILHEIIPCLERVLTQDGKMSDL